MKKRLLAMLLCLCMVAAFLPTVALAAGMDITNTGVDIWPGKNGTDGPTPSRTYTAGDGTVAWDLSTLTLTLTNATINATEAQYGNALEIVQVSGSNPEINIVLNGTNTIRSKDTTLSTPSYAISSSACPLRFSGSGTLTAIAGDAANGTSIGIKCFGLTVEQGATVNAVGGTSSSQSYGVSSSAEVTVAGTLKATAGSGGTPIGMSVSYGLVVEEGGVLEARGSTTMSTSYGINFSGTDIPVTVKGTLSAIGFAPFGNKNANYQNDVILKGADSESDTLQIYTPTPVSYQATSGANNPKYIVITPNSKTPQETLTITNQPTGTIHYGDSFKLDTSGGSGEGAVSWTATGPAEVTADGTVTVTGVGAVTVTATKAGDTTYAEASATCTFTSEKATPSVGEVTCTEEIHPGTAPATVSLQHSGTTGGTAKLADDTIFELGEKDYDWVFTPTDTANYTNATGTVKLNVTQAALSSIAVTTQPNEKMYTVGDTFDPAGMVVTATYADGTTAVISNYEVQYTSGTALKVSDTSVTLRYTEGSVTKTCILSGLTVNKKNLAPLNAEVSARYNDTTAQSFDFGTLLPSDCGTVSSVTVSAITSSEILASALGDKDTKVVSWTLKSDLSGVEKNETVTITVSTENYSDITIQLKVTATVKTPVDITGVIAQNGTYNGKPHTGYTGTPAAGAYSGDLSITYDGGSAPVNVGNHTVTIAVPDSDEAYTGSVTLSFQIEQATVTVKADNKTATVGGTKPALTATVSGLAEGEALKTEPTLTCDANMNTAGIYAITASDAAVPDGGNYRAEIVYQPGTLTISSASSSSSSSSSSGGSSSNTSSSTTTNPDGSTTTTIENKTTGTVTETTKNKDGSQTVVETKKDGTVTTTETDAEGNKSKEVQSPDGSKELTVTQKDGTTATVTTDTEGKAEAEVKLPSKVVSEAQESGEVVALPIPKVKAAQDIKTASTVTVKTGRKEPVKVEIPVFDPTPGTVAVIVNADGTEKIVKTSVSSEDGVVVALPDDTTVKLVDNSKDFVDVPAGNWAADAVSFSSARELFSGTSEDTFSPDALMTRGMLMTVLARFDGEDTSGGGTWYQKGMDWAVSNGISDGSDPNGDITREQLVVMLWRYSGSPAASGTLDGFNDAGEVSSYAWDAMRWAVENGIVNGFGNDQLAPKGNATRAQVAQLMKNFIEM